MDIDVGWPAEFRVVDFKILIYGATRKSARFNELNFYARHFFSLSFGMAYRVMFFLSRKPFQLTLDFFFEARVTCLSYVLTFSFQRF